MKKLKAVLCTVLLFIVCAVMCVGCGATPEQPNDNKPNNPSTPTGTRESIVSLTDARRFIKMALEINGSANDSILEKLGNFNYNSQVELYDDKNTPEDMEMSGIFQYTNGNFVKYYLETTREQGSTNSRYCTNSTEYVYNGSYIHEQEQIENNTAVVTIFDKALSDEAFNLIYDSQVKHIVNKEEISYKFKTGLKGFLQLTRLTLGQSIGEDFEQEWLEIENSLTAKELKGYYCSVTVKLDLYGRVTGAEIDSFYTMTADQKYQYKEIHSITKTTDQITQPQWLTDYLASKN